MKYKLFGLTVALSIINQCDSMDFRHFPKDKPPDQTYIAKISVQNPVFVAKKEPLRLPDTISGSYFPEKNSLHLPDIVPDSYLPKKEPPHLPEIIPYTYLSALPARILFFRPVVT